MGETNNKHFGGGRKRVIVICVASLLTALAVGAFLYSRDRVYNLHFILRPDDTGHWYVQSDIDHARVGVTPEVDQTAEYLEVNFDRVYTHAVTIQVTSDDDFGQVITGHSNLGVTGARIRIWHAGAVIDPATVWDYVPRGGGNLWVDVTMMDRAKLPRGR